MESFWRLTVLYSSSKLARLGVVAVHVKCTTRLVGMMNVLKEEEEEEEEEEQRWTCQNWWIERRKGSNMRVPQDALSRGVVVDQVLANEEVRRLGKEELTC